MQQVKRAHEDAFVIAFTNNEACTYHVNPRESEDLETQLVQPVHTLDDLCFERIHL